MNIFAKLLDKKNLTVVIPALLVIVFIGVIGVIFSRASKPETQQALPAEEKKIEFGDEDTSEGPIPTVGQEVKVDIQSVVKGQDIKLVIQRVPTQTRAIEYEVTYSTTEQDSEGINGTAKPEKSQATIPSTFMRELKLGTCSKNVCRYQKLTSDLHVSLKFIGAYGEKLFEGDFPFENL